MEKKQMNIAVSLNQKYFYYTYVMLTSLFKNNPESCVTVYILHSELTEEQIESFAILARQYGGEVCSVLIGKETFPKQLPTTEAWSIEAYYRLVMPDLLPTELERVLYIDVDTIIVNSIRELYDMDFEDKLLCVCKDVPTEGNDVYREARRAVFESLFEKGFVYFNSGVMLWNLKKIRSRYSLKFYMETAREMGYQFVSPDQDILNYCHWNEVRYFDSSIYNQFARIAHNKGRTLKDVLQNVCILHYAGSKPWHVDAVHFDLEKIWWDYAKITPYYSILCEEFINKIMLGRELEQRFDSLLKEINTLRSDLNESLTLNERLLAMLNQR